MYFPKRGKVGERGAKETVMVNPPDNAECSASPINPICPYLALLYIGYERLDEWVCVIDPAAPVYTHLLVEQEYTEVHSNEGNRRIDHHRLVVGQPDAQNRVHYYRVTLATLVYVNGVPFDPEHEKVLAEAKRGYEQVVRWLERDFTIWRGMVAMPAGLVQVEGVIPQNLLSILEDEHADS
jgi:hypothetical protein